MYLKERLEQCRKDKAAIEAEEKKLEQQIKEQKVPVIKHGDYGYWDGKLNDPVIFINRWEDKELTVVNINGICSFKVLDCDKRLFVKVGNIFDDLKNKGEF